MEEIIKIEHMKYSYRTKYQTVHALRDVSASFQSGTFSAIVGKSGSGKSTLLSILSGLYLPDEGEVFFQGKSLKEMDLNEYRRASAAVIYQSFRLFPLMTIEENITYPMENQGIKRKTAKERAKELVNLVNLNESVLPRFPQMLSGGEQQRIAIARAVGMNTKLILADEPTGNLDTENTKHVIEILKKLAHENGYCIIMVTHDMEAADAADEIYQMRDGELILQRKRSD